MTVYIEDTSPGPHTPYLESTNTIAVTDPFQNNRVSLSTTRSSNSVG